MFNNDAQYAYDEQILMYLLNNKTKQKKITLIKTLTSSTGQALYAHMK